VTKKITIPESTLYVGDFETPELELTPIVCPECGASSLDDTTDDRLFQVEWTALQVAQVWWMAGDAAVGDIANSQGFDDPDERSWITCYARRDSEGGEGYCGHKFQQSSDLGATQDAVKLGAVELRRRLSQTGSFVQHGVETTTARVVNQDLHRALASGLAAVGYEVTVWHEDEKRHYEVILSTTGQILGAHRKEPIAERRVDTATRSRPVSHLSN